MPLSQSFKISKLPSNITLHSKGGLGLPDREYYLKDDSKTVELRNQYKQHISNFFQLIGYANISNSRSHKHHLISI